MNKKSWLINVSLVIFIFSVLAFGIYAVKTASLSMNGTVGFISHDCKVSVLGTITGAIRQDPATNELVEVNNKQYIFNQYIQNSTENIIWNDQFNNGTTNVAKEITTNDVWNFGDIYFNDLSSSENIKPIVITLDIYNNSDYSINVQIGEIQSSDVIKVQTSPITTVQKGLMQSVTITFTLQELVQEDSKITLQQIPVTFTKS